MLDILLDTIMDTLKLIPFLFLAYLLIEFIEQKAGDKTTKVIQKSGKLGPVIGSLLGVVPQCGFSTAASNLYAGKIITMGTLIAVFLSTSDEMLPILISEATPIAIILFVLSVKIVIAMITGVLVDILFKKKAEADRKEEIHKLCHEEHCHCEEQGIWKSSIIHTLQIVAYIFLISLVINCIVEGIGEERIASVIFNVPVLGPIVASLIGLIPNCASAVILTQLYLENMINMSSLIAGLLVNSGIGILVLFKVNKNQKENFSIISILYVVGALSGILLDFIL